MKLKLSLFVYSVKPAKSKGYIIDKLHTTEVTTHALHRVVVQMDTEGSQGVYLLVSWKPYITKAPLVVYLSQTTGRGSWTMTASCKLKQCHVS